MEKVINIHLFLDICIQIEFIAGLFQKMLKRKSEDYTKTNFNVNYYYF